MTAELAAYLAIGIVLSVLGVLTWKKQTTAFLHSYHYKKVKEEEIPAYTKQMGIGQIIVGAAFLLTAILGLLSKRTASRAVFAVGLAAGLAVILRAQFKHNGSVF